MFIQKAMVAGGNVEVSCQILILSVDTMLNEMVKVHGRDVREIMGYSFYLDNVSTWYFGTPLHMVANAE